MPWFVSGSPGFFIAHRAERPFTMATVKYQTSTGVSLDFHVCSQDANWNDVAGIYAFCRLNANGHYDVYYVGQAASFKDRIPNHERWPGAVRRGATMVLAAAVARQGDRDKLEALLISELQPPMNIQLR